MGLGLRIGQGEEPELALLRIGSPARLGLKDWGLGFGFRISGKVRVSLGLGFRARVRFRARAKLRICV